MKKISVSAKQMNINLILGALCIIIFSLAFWVNDPFELFVSNYETSDPLITDLETNKLNRISVQKNEKETLGFHKKSAADNSWIVKEPNNPQEHRADFPHINKALENLLAVKKYQQVTSNKKRHAEFHLDSASGMKILLFNEGAKKPNIQVYLGKSGSNFNSTLVRLEGDDSVYSAKGNLKTDWEQTLDHFRDKALFQLAPENIESYALTGKFIYSVQKNKLKEWEVFERGNPIPTLAEQNKVTDVLKKICDLTADKFHEGGALPRKVHAKITITSTNKTKLNMDILGPNKEDMFLVKTTQAPFWASVSKWKIDNILIKPNDMKSKKEASPKIPVK